MKRFEIMLEVTTSFTITDTYALMQLLIDSFEMSGDDDALDATVFYDLDIYDKTDDNQCIAKVLVDSSLDQDALAASVFYQFEDPRVSNVVFKQILPAF